MSRPDEPPSTRGDATRQALVEAAIEVFGRDGFHAAGTRSLAEAAGVNQALIGYHFGGKEGLYQAAIEHVAGAIGARIDPLVETIDREIGELDPSLPPAQRAERALPYLHRLTDAMVGLLTSEESTPWARLILREQQEPSPAFRALYGGVMGRLLRLVGRLVAYARALEPDSEAARLSAFTLLGQVMAVRAARATLLRHLGWERIGEAELARLRGRIRRNVSAILNDPNSEEAKS